MNHFKKITDRWKVGESIKDVVKGPLLIIRVK